VLRTLQAAEIAGVRAILVHAISERARKFYEDCGFIASPMDPMTLMITVAEAAKALVAAVSFDRDEVAADIDQYAAVQFFVRRTGLLRNNR
jgi:hypothetical protein